MLTTSRYRVLAKGPHHVDRARLVHREGLDFRPQGALEARIEAMCQQLRAQGRRVERLPVYRVADWTAEGEFRLEVGVTDYGVALAQRLHPEWFEERLPTLAVCGLTVTGDHVILEERSAQVAVSAGLTHIKPSGNVQPPEDLWTAVRREAQEELGWDGPDAQAARVLGLVVCHEVLMDVVYRLPCPLPLADLLRGGSDRWEHDRLLGVDCSREPLARYCLEEFQRCSPPGHAALLLEGEYRYGPEWLEGVFRNL